MLYISLSPVQRCYSTFKWVTTAYFQILHAPRCCPWTRSRFKVYHINSAFETASLNRQTIAVLRLSARRHNFVTEHYIQCIGQASIATSHQLFNGKPFTCCADYTAESEIFGNPWRRTTGPMLRASYNSFSPSTLPTWVGVLKCWGKKRRGRLRVSVSDPLLWFILQVEINRCPFLSLGLTAFGGLGSLEFYGVKSFCAIYRCLDDVKA